MHLEYSQKPDLVFSDHGQERGIVQSMLLLPLVCLESCKESASLVEGDPGRIDRKIWYPDKDKDAEDDGDQSLNNENPTPSFKSCSTTDIDNGIG